MALRRRVARTAALPGALSALLLLAALALARGENSAGSRLREVLRTKRCLGGRETVFPFQDERLWVFEVNDWTSQQLTTTIAAILLKEHAGYGVDINHVPSGSGIHKRLAKDAIEGAAMMEHFESGRSFGYANLEVWPAGQRDLYTQYVSSQGSVRDLGSVGYDGRSGWYVSRAFARDARFLITPEFYRAYDRTGHRAAPVVDALRAQSSVLCGSPGVCSGGSAADCPGVREGRTVEWCPAKVDEALPVVLSPVPFIDQGFNEEISQSNGMSFAMRYVGYANFTTAAYDLLSNGSAQVVHLWWPSLATTSLEQLGVRTVRVMLPSEDCGVHRLDGRGDWSCDFPLQQLSKLVSGEVLKDPVMQKFFRKFSLPQGREKVLTSELQGGGVRDMMVDLLQRHQGSATLPATAEEIFDTACAWIRANENTGARWEYWVEDRNVPFFADSLHWSFPFPFLAGLITVALGIIIFLEWPWLHTTLVPSTARRIKARTHGHTRTELDLRLRDSTKASSSSTSSNASPKTPLGQTFGFGLAASPPSNRSKPRAPPPSSRLSGDYWKGLLQRALQKPGVPEFWKAVEAWAEKSRRQRTLPAATEPAKPDFIYLAHHTFPCIQQTKHVSVPILRSTAGAESGKAVEVEVVVEECDGGAKRVKDFHAGVHKIHFGPGQDHHILTIPVRHHKDLWQNSYWFQVRLTKILDGDALLASPAEAKVLVLDEDIWPANIPTGKRGGEGMSLMRYFIYAERTRRGEKWRKTMLAMCWLPVHSVFVSTVVQKILVDHVVKGIQGTSNYSDIVWFYTESIILVVVQLISLGLNRWADVVQTRNRGRTGGIRQHHRGELLRKYMHMEHSEHWLASDASWLYASIFDADVITGQAYFEVFVLAQSIVALSLSVVLVVGLAFWGYAQSSASSDQVHSSPGSLQAIWYVLGVFVIIPLGLLGVWKRKALTWSAVISRKDLECAWFKSCTWIITNWRYLYGLSSRERVALEKRVLKQNNEFVPAHWDARDTMNDTAWVTHWIQGVGYCAMLIFGLFALCEYNRFGIGAMEVGTFYALCKIYLTVGKYVGRLSGVFVNMQRAVVSLREIAALNNQVDQRSQRREAKRWETITRSYGKARLLRKSSAHLSYPENLGISFVNDLRFVRPAECKVGSTFAEIRLKACTIPLGFVVHVTARNERVLRTLLGLASQVIHPTDEFGNELPEDWEGVTVPPGMKVLMLPTGPIGMGATAPSIIEQLEFTGAPRDLCLAVAEACGLEPLRETSTLGTGSMQVFSIVRAVLCDPDVICAFRPLSIVPMDMRANMHLLLRVWQGRGGLPAIAEYLKVPIVEERPLYRSNRRTLIVGNPELDLWGGFPMDVHLDLEHYLMREPEGPCDPELSEQESDRMLMREGHSWMPLRAAGGPNLSPARLLGL